MTIIYTPHDRYFKTSMAHLKVAQEFFQHYLPKHIQHLIDFSSLQYEDKIFVDETLRKQESDMLYSVHFNGRKGYLYLLIEHESSIERMMPWRLLQYMMNIMREHLKHTESTYLPLIVPLIFYTGEKPYHSSTGLLDLFCEDHRNLAQDMFIQPYTLIDLTQLTDQQLEVCLWSGLMTKIMKHIRDDDMLGVIEGMIDHMKRIEKMQGKDYIYATLTYCFECGHVKDEKKLIELTKTQLSEEIGENIMSLAQQYIAKGIEQGIKQGIERGIEQGIEQGMERGIEQGIERGIEQGIEQGIQKGRLIGIAEGKVEGINLGKIEVALKLLQQGLSLKQVAHITELPLQEIKKFKNRKYH